MILRVWTHNNPDINILFLNIMVILNTPGDSWPIQKIYNNVSLPKTNQEYLNDKNKMQR